MRFTKEIANLLSNPHKNLYMQAIFECIDQDKSFILLVSNDISFVKRTYKNVADSTLWMGANRSD